MSIENLYPSVKPSLDLNFAAGNFDPRITFSRASGATHYDGKTVAKAEENLLTKSQEFDSTPWTKSSITVISDTSLAPDGTTTADRLQESASGAASRRVEVTSPTLQVATYTLSIFAKAAELSFVRLTEASTGSARTTWFNLASGSAATTAPAHSAVMAGLGNGWYRCSITFLAGTAASSLAVGISNTDNVTSYTGNGSDGLLVWGAQLEQRSQVTAYTATQASPVTNYIPVLQTAPANVPRIDYDPVTGECKGLLVEEQRTNLLTYSEQFDNSSWMRNGTSVTSNILVAPDGNIGADKLVEDSMNSAKNITTSSLSYSFTGGSYYTLSFFVKKAERQFAQTFFHPSAFGNVYANFDLNLGTVTVASGVVAAIAGVGNGWYRCSISARAVTTFTARAGFLAIIPAGTSTYSQSYTGDGYSGIYIWGAQLELGTFPTSYIKTEVSQVTLAADSASMTGTNFSSWYRQDEGTLYGKSASKSDASLLTVWDGTSNNRIAITCNSALTTTSSGFVVRDGAVQTSGFSYTFSAENKVALAYKTNDVATTVNGASVQFDTSVLLPRVSGMILGVSGTPFNGHIKRITYYPRRLSNTDLQALTA